ncbi:hypothetical protein GCM10010191_95420 [Actinomadura vinacea]|uniref:Uncharacterized protein n=1 Tax=Actinomadura vinacea TaxID=115336 RepID=A0ABP5XSF5_9ACTN
MLALIARLGAEPAWIRIVGCEGARFAAGTGLSGPVAAAVDGAVRLVQELVSAVGAVRDDAAAERARTGRRT